MKIFAIVLAVFGVLNLILAYLVAADKIKPSKSIEVIYFILVSISLFSSAFHWFLN